MLRITPNRNPKPKNFTNAIIKAAEQIGLPITKEARMLNGEIVKQPPSPNDLSKDVIEKKE
ncbi:20999_t:CDS:2 [Rhizophagus irregularis]|nr:20999_t:CDS:2 [Rhizophagus irregularis]